MGYSGVGVHHRLPPGADHRGYRLAVADRHARNRGRRGQLQPQEITDTSEYDLGEFCATGASTIGQLSIALTGLIALAYVIWNLGYRQGTTGSSIGKGIMKFKIVSEKTGQPIGFGMSVVRELIYLVFAGLCGIIWLIAVLFPLWDVKRQTLVDKIISTIALPL